MALINCPECGKEIEKINRICPECGYQLKEDDKQHMSIVANGNKSILGVLLCIVGCILLIIAFKTITSSKYKFYTENYGTYVAGYEENIEKSNSYSWGLLKSGYSDIASGYKTMADEAKHTIVSGILYSIESGN